MLLIVGLDGASLELVLPWVRAGGLPNLGQLLAEGAWGVLRSTLPPATLPAWSTFMTGVNPGRHGIFDFTQRVPGTYQVRFLNGSQRKAPSVWRYLSAAGKRVAVFGVPGTYPPEAVNGCMISGFDTPVTTRADASFVYPPEMADEVEANGGFPFADFQEFCVDHDWHRVALNSLLEGIDLKRRLTVRHLQRERWDCAMVLFGESDTVAHHFWRFSDAQSPRFDADGAREFDAAIRAVYVALDSALGELIAACDPDAVLLCSDHGFGGAGNCIIHLNRQLERAGLLGWRRRGALTSRAGTAKRWLLRWLPPELQARCFRFAGGWFANALESAARFSGIDWAQTLAFSEELNYSPSVWLNIKGRDPEGTVSSIDYDRTCDEVAATLLAMRDPECDRPIVAQVWRRDQIYHGPWVDLAPDLIIEFHLCNGYSYVCLPSCGQGEGQPIRMLSPGECGGGKLAGMSGSHRRDGLFALQGPAAPGMLQGGADLADMTPTILALCGVPIPEDLDGEVLECVRCRFSRGASARNGPALGQEREYTGAEAGVIERRLHSLGYIE